MQDQLYVKAACEMLLQYGKPDMKAKLKRCIRKYILGQSVAPDDPIFWPTGLLAAGLWRRFILSGKGNEGAAEKEGSLKADPALAKEIETALDAYYERWKKKGFPIACLDDLLTGEVFLDIYLTGRADQKQTDYKNDYGNGLLPMKEGLDAYKTAADKLAAYALAHPTDRNGCFPYRSHWKEKHIYADSIGLACPFLYRYGVAFKKQECVETAIRQIERFFACGMDRETGLPYHGYEADSGVKYGIIGWGRAVGWLLRGMQGCMQTTYGREKLESSYRSLMDKVLSYQRKDGLFSWQLQALEGPADTSATGMICAALQEGIRTGVLKEEKYRQALKLGCEAIFRTAKGGLIYQCSGECEGFGCYPQIYGAYPWSLGPALLLLEETV